MGLTALALPEADGGFGGGALDLMAAMEACGQALVVEPLLDNIGLAGRLVARAGSQAQRTALLPGLVDGSLRLAFAALEPGRRYDMAPQATTARKAGEGQKDFLKCTMKEVKITSVHPGASAGGDYRRALRRRLPAQPEAGLPACLTPPRRAGHSAGPSADSRRRSPNS